jgi:hypothetical protein
VAWGLQVQPHPAEQRRDEALGLSKGQFVLYLGFTLLDLVEAMVLHPSQDHRPLCRCWAFMHQHRSGGMRASFSDFYRGLVPLSEID